MDLAKASRDPWVWGQFLLIGIVLAGAPWAARALPAGQSGAALKFVGAILLAVSLGLVARAGLALGPNLTPGVEPLPEGMLVTDGIYALVRHPLYTGLIAGLTGYALLWGNWLVGLGAGLAALLYFEGKARAEERWLRQRFPAYEAYAQRVPRIFPFGWR